MIWGDAITYMFTLQALSLSNSPNFRYRHPKLTSPRIHTLKFLILVDLVYKNRKSDVNFLHLHQALCRAGPWRQAQEGKGPREAVVFVPRLRLFSLPQMGHCK